MNQFRRTWECLQAVASSQSASTPLAARPARRVNDQIGGRKIIAGAEQRRAALLGNRINHQIEQVEHASRPVSLAEARIRFARDPGVFAGESNDIEAQLREAVEQHRSFAAKTDTVPRRDT